MEWDQLYDFQKEFRARREISAASLLRCLKLSPNSLQYLYSKKIQPSKKDGSIGLELRKTLEQLKKSEKMQADLFDDSTLSEKINEVILCEDNQKVLNDAQILDVIVADEGSNGVSVFCSGRYDETRVQETLSGLIPSLRITSFESTQLLGYFEAPICMTSNAGNALFGTGCVVHNENGIFGLTAKHVLLGLASDNCSPRQLTADENTESANFKVLARSSSTCCVTNGRYHNEQTTEEIGWFGCVNFHPTQDIATFRVSLDHGFSVNKFLPGRSFSLSQNNLEKAILIVGAKVCKVGAASGTTFGQISEATNGKPLFWVSSSEVGLFATPGDSGALVVTEDNVAVGMVIQGNLQRTLCLNICCLVSMPC